MLVGRGRQLDDFFSVITSLCPSRRQRSPCSTSLLATTLCALPHTAPVSRWPRSCTARLHLTRHHPSPCVLTTPITSRHHRLGHASAIAPSSTLPHHPRPPCSPRFSPCWAVVRPPYHYCLNLPVGALDLVVRGPNQAPMAPATTTQSPPYDLGSAPGHHDCERRKGAPPPPSLHLHSFIGSHSGGGEEGKEVAMAVAWLPPVPPLGSSDVSHGFHIMQFKSSILQSFFMSKYPGFV